MDLSISSLAEDKIWTGIKIAAWMNASYYNTTILSQKKLFVSIIFEIGFASFNRISFCPKVFSIHFEATTKSMKWENFFKFIYCKAGNLRSIGIPYVLKLLRYTKFLSNLSSWSNCQRLRTLLFKGNEFFFCNYFGMALYIC